MTANRMPLPAVILAALTLPLTLVACSTPPPYGPATRPGGQGFTEQRIESNRFRVSYRGASLEAAEEGALLRAAELTRLAGGEWFQVVSRSAERQGAGRAGGTSVGIGGGTGVRTGVGVGVGISLPLGRPRSLGEAEVSLEILTGRGPKPAGPDYYDASQVASNLSGEVRRDGF